MVENYPGFPGGVSGIRLADLIRRGIERWSIEIIPEQVVSLERRREGFELRTPERIRSHRIVIVATGTRPRRLTGIPVDERARDRVFYEVPPPEDIQIRTLGILGAGDVAVDYALGFSEKSEVHVFHRSPVPTCLPLLLRRAREKGVHFHGEHSLMAVGADDSGLTLEFPDTSQRVDALLPAIGREPVLDFLDSRLREERDKRESSDLFFIGDVVNEQYRQVAIAAGDGLRAAMEVTRRCG
jgi:thioredoxin reductase (NADPH)